MEVGHLKDLGRQKPLLAEGTDGQGVVAFGEADAVVVGEKFGVEVGWRGKIEGAVEEDLAGSGFEEVATAQYFGDGGVGVVDNAGELVARETVLAPDEEVAEIFACSEGLGAKVAICEGYRCTVGNSKTVVRGGFQGVRGRVGGAAMAAVDKLVVGVFMGGMHHAGEVLTAAGAGVNVALFEQLVERGAV